jgi:hypothetical protein
MLIGETRWPRVVWISGSLLHPTPVEIHARRANDPEQSRKITRSSFRFFENVHHLLQVINGGKLYLQFFNSVRDYQGTGRYTPQSKLTVYSRHAAFK